MAVTVLDTTTAAKAASLAKSISTGSDRGLLVHVSYEGFFNDITAITGCNYGDQAMTPLFDSILVDGGNNELWLRDFWLPEANIAAASGTNIVPTFSGGTPDSNRIVIMATSYQDCGTPVSLDTDSGTSSTSNDTFTLALAGAVDSMLVGALNHVDSDSHTVNNGWTTDLTEIGDAHRLTQASLATSDGSSQTCSITSDSSGSAQLWMMSVVLIPVPAAASIVIVSVDGDDSILSEQQNVSVVTTNAGATQGSVSLISGAQSASCNVDSWSDTAVQIDVPESISNDLLFGAATLRVTRDDAAYAERNITLTPKSGFAFSVLVSGFNTTPAESVAAPEHWQSSTPAVGDALYYSLTTNKGAALTLNDKGEIQLTGGQNQRHRFSVWVYDITDDTWGAAKTFEVDGYGNIINSIAVPVVGLLTQPVTEPVAQ